MLKTLRSYGQPRVLPMYAPKDDTPIVLEICPRTTLIRMHLNLQYAGAADAQVHAREHILAAIQEANPAGKVSTPDAALRQVIISDAGGTR